MKSNCLRNLQKIKRILHQGTCNNSAPSSSVVGVAAALPSKHLAALQTWVWESPAHGFEVVKACNLSLPLVNGEKQTSPENDSSSGLFWKYISPWSGYFSPLAGFVGYILITSAVHYWPFSLSSLLGILHNLNLLLQWICAALWKELYRRTRTKSVSQQWSPLE